MKHKYLHNKLNSSTNQSTFYREYYLRAPFACNILDCCGKIYDVNSYWENTLGYLKEEVKGKNFCSILHPDHYPDFETMFSNLKSDGKVNNVKFRLQHKRGNYVYVSLNAVILRDDKGILQYVYFAFHDMSADITVFNELKESEQRYKSIFFEGKSIMLLIDPQDGSIVDANFAAEQFYGYSRRIMKSMNINDINALPVNVVHEKMQNAKANKENYFLFQHRMADGSIKDVEVYSGKIILSNRTLLYSIIHDVTESKRNEERLNKAEKIADIGSWEINLSTREVSVSPGAKKIYGLNEEKLTIEMVKSFPLKEYRELLDKALEDLIHGRVPYDVEFKIYRPLDGNILYIRSIAVFKSETNSVFGVIKDITRRKKYEEELKCAKERAEEVGRLKSAFLSTVSHELRTPLNSIIGLSDLVNERMNIEEILVMNSVINSSGKTLLEIIDTILDISILDTERIKIDKEKFLLSKLFGELNEFVERESLENTNVGIKFIPQGNPGIISIFSDYNRIRKLLKNLIKNAIKFTEKGLITFGFTIEEKSIVFFVKDTGVGIPEDQKEIIFQSFRQLDDTLARKYAGIGLGLTVCKKISDVLNGEIWVESVEGEGSVFYFKLSDINLHC